MLSDEIIKKFLLYNRKTIHTCEQSCLAPQKRVGLDVYQWGGDAKKGQRVAMHALSVTCMCGHENHSAWKQYPHQVCNTHSNGFFQSLVVDRNKN